MKNLLTVLGFLAIAVGSSPAHAADKQGPKGLVWAVEVNTPGSEEYSSNRGAVWIKSWNKKKKKPAIAQYQWGGSNCPNRDLDGDQVQVLTLAMSRNMKVRPRWVPGQLPNTRCLVAFTTFRAWQGEGQP